MAMLQPQGVLYPYREAYEARDRYLKKWICPKWDDTGIPAWEEAWAIDEYRMLVKIFVHKSSMVLKAVFYCNSFFYISLGVIPRSSWQLASRGLALGIVKKDSW